MVTISRPESRLVWQYHNGHMERQSVSSARLTLRTVRSARLTLRTVRSARLTLRTVSLSSDINKTKQFHQTVCEYYGK